MEQIRTFIAIELPDEIKRYLTELENRLRDSTAIPAKWVNPEGIHLTLKFLGNVNSNKLNGITKVLENAAASVTPFALNIKEAGAFPNLRKVQIVWIGLDGDTEPLKLLQSRIEDGLVPLGFSREKREFTPHLTLARVRDTASPAEREQLGSAIAGLATDSACSFKVTSVSVMRSQLSREGARYSQIAGIRLPAILP